MLGILKHDHSQFILGNRMDLYKRFDKSRLGWAVVLQEFGSTSKGFYLVYDH